PMRAARARVNRRRFLSHVTVDEPPGLTELGTRGYGSWVVPLGLLGPDSICYLAGAGEDISFDLELIAHCRCPVHVFDPVPRVREYVARTTSDRRLVFHPVGLWSCDGNLAFHAPLNPGWVSHSATNVHGTDVALVAPVRSVASLMRELGHDHLDLLKLCVE